MIASRIATGVAAHEAGCHIAIDAERKWALVAGSYGLAAFDIQEVQAPRKMAFVKTGVASFGGGCYVLIDGGEREMVAYTVGGYGLAVISLAGLRAEPASMAKIGGCETGVCTVNGDEAAQLLAEDGLLFVAGGDVFSVIDVSTPTEPTKITQIKTGVGSNMGGAHCIMHGERPIVYFAGGYGLAVIDVSDPRAPAKVGATIKTGAASALGDEGMVISADKRTLFVSGGDGLATFDIATDPLLPARLSWMSTGVATKDGGAHIGLVSPSYVIVAGGLGLAAIDVSDREQPAKLNTTSSGVATVKGGAHIAIYGEQAEYAVVVGGMGLSILSTNHGEWQPSGACSCAVM